MGEKAVSLARLAFFSSASPAFVLRLPTSSRKPPSLLLQSSPCIDKDRLLVRLLPLLLRQGLHAGDVAVGRRVGSRKRVVVESDGGSGEMRKRERGKRKRER
jgi:hypothetical protein